MLQQRATVRQHFLKRHLRVKEQKPSPPLLIAFTRRRRLQSQLSPWAAAAEEAARAMEAQQKEVCGRFFCFCKGKTVFLALRTSGDFGCLSKSPSFYSLFFSFFSRLLKQIQVFVTEGPSLTYFVPKKQQN